ncbi:hypothetical protein D3C80_2031250 [compost metagenome]
MLVDAISGIHNAGIDMIGEEMWRAGGRVSHHHHIHFHGQDIFSRIDQGFTFGYRTAGCCEINRIGT